MACILDHPDHSICRDSNCNECCRVMSHDISHPFKLSQTTQQGISLQRLRCSFRSRCRSGTQTLLSVTGSGKTFTIAKVVERIKRPTIVMAHNKTLVAQLYGEFKEFFPHNAVEYFVSYYDYYQPEAYVPASDTFIEKDASLTTISNRCDYRRPKRYSSVKIFIVATVS